MEIIAQGNQNDVVTLTGANLGNSGDLARLHGPVTAETFRNQRERAVMAMWPVNS